MDCCHLEGWTKNFVGTPHPGIRAIFREAHYNQYMLEHNTCLSQAVFYNSDASVDRIIPTATEKRSGLNRTILLADGNALLRNGRYIFCCRECLC